MKNKSQNNSNNTILKLKLYIISLWLLFVLVFLLTVDFPLNFWNHKEEFNFLTFLKNNWLPILSLIMIVIIIILIININRKWSGVCNPPYTIKTIKNENYEYMTFLTTYIIPLISIDLSNERYAFILIVLLILIGVVFIKMDLYYGNPTLALLGYRLYRVTLVENENDILIISKNYLHEGQPFKWIRIDNNVFLAKEILEYGV